jgi:hypothetical protein
MRFAGLLVLLVATTAHANDVTPHAMDDIVDVRNGRDPHRMHVLGWAADGSVFVRIASCSTFSGTYFYCKISMEQIDRFGDAKETVLIDEYKFCEENVPQKDCRWSVMDKETGDKLIARERKFLRKLPPITRGIQVVDPKRVLGSDVELRAPLDTFAFDMGNTGIDAGLVARFGKKRRARISTRRHDGDSTDDSAALLTRAWLSPTRTRALVEVRYTGGNGVKYIDAHAFELVEARMAIP